MWGEPKLYCVLLWICILWNNVPICVPMHYTRHANSHTFQMSLLILTSYYQPCQRSHSQMGRLASLLHRCRLHPFWSCLQILLHQPTLIPHSGTPHPQHLMKFTTRWASVLGPLWMYCSHGNHKFWISKPVWVCLPILFMSAVHDRAGVSVQYWWVVNFIVASASARQQYAPYICPWPYKTHDTGCMTGQVS